MATQKADVGSDFATVLGRAMEPPVPTDPVGRDLPDGFPFSPPTTHRVVDTSKDPSGIEGAVAYDYKIQRRVFVIYKPWEHCARCTNDIAQNTVTIPDEGDYECPHINVKVYKEIVDKILAAELIFGSEQEVVQKDGSIVISLRWYEPIKNHKRSRERAREIAKANGFPATGQQTESDV